MGAQLFHADRRTDDGQTGITKLLVAFRKSANSPKNVCTCKMFCAMLWSELCNWSVDSVVVTWRFSILCIHHTYTQYTYNTALYAYINAHVCTYLFILFIYLWIRIGSRCTHSVHGLATGLWRARYLSDKSRPRSGITRSIFILSSLLDSGLKSDIFISRRSTQIFLCISRYLPACNIPWRGIAVSVTTEYGRPSKVWCSQHYGRPSNVSGRHYGRPSNVRCSQHYGRPSNVGGGKH